MCVCRLPIAGVGVYASLESWALLACEIRKNKKRSYPLKNNSWHYFPYLIWLPAVVCYLFFLIFLSLQFAVIIIITLVMFIHVEFS